MFKIHPPHTPPPPTLVLATFIYLSLPLFSETLEALKFKERERDVVNDFLLTSKVETVVAAPRNWQGREFGFSQVKVLSGLPNQDTALRILEELAADPGVLAVMRKVFFDFSRFPCLLAWFKCSFSSSSSCAA